MGDILINEIKTIGNKYIEMFSNFEVPTTLKNTALVGVEQSGDKYKTPFLKLKFVVDLDGIEVGAGNQYHVISNGEFQSHGQTITSIVPPIPSSRWRIFSGTGANWLDVANKNFLSVLLVENQEKPIFEVPFPQAAGRSTTTSLKEDLLKYVQESVTDFVSVKHPKGPDHCKTLDSVLSNKYSRKEPWDDFIIEQTETRMYTTMSISRCDSYDHFDLRSFVHCRETPSRENDCENYQKQINQDLQPQ